MSRSLSWIARLAVALLISLLAPSLPSLPSLAAAPLRQVNPAVRVTSSVLGEAMEIEVGGLAGEEAAGPAEAAAREALGAAEALARDSDPERSGALAALNAAAGAGVRPIPASLAALLGRALDICLWSEGAHGPLGRDLNNLWGIRAPVAALPATPELAAAVEAAGCTNLQLDARKGTVTLAAGTGLDLRGFAAGAVVDRAVEVLQQRGVATGLVRLGEIWRGFGEGPAGKGWPVPLTALPGQAEPPGPVWLRDRSLVRVSVRDRPLRIAGEELASYLNQRTGRPAAGTLAVLVSTERALDAEALAVALLITGPREGQMRLGSLQPRPAVQWALGSGEGDPLLIEYHWSDLPKR